MVRSSLQQQKHRSLTQPQSKQYLSQHTIDDGKYDTFDQLLLVINFSKLTPRTYLLSL